MRLQKTQVRKTSPDQNSPNQQQKVHKRRTKLSTCLGNWPRPKKEKNINRETKTKKTDSQQSVAPGAHRAARAPQHTPVKRRDGRDITLRPNRPADAVRRGPQPPLSKQLAHEGHYSHVPWDAVEVAVPMLWVELTPNKNSTNLSPIRNPIGFVPGTIPGFATEIVETFRLATAS